MADDTHSGRHYDYIDFSVEIRESDDRNRYVVAVSSPEGQVQEETSLPFNERELQDKLRDVEVALLRSGGSRRRIGTPDEQTIQGFGRALREAMFVGQVETHYRMNLREAKRENKGLRLKLHVQPLEQSTLPWEFVCYPELQLQKVRSMSQDSSFWQPVAKLCQDQQAEKPRDYDMVDSGDDFQRWPKLKPVLRDCGTTIVEAYHVADATSRRHQAKHWWIVLFAALFAMSAVLFAIVQLSPLGPRVPSAKVFEVLAAGAVVASVGLGWKAAFSKHWLVKREEAEQYRFSKFGFLLNPELWNGVTPETRQGRLREWIERLDTFDWQTLKRLAVREGSALEVVLPTTTAHIDEAVLKQIVDYYKEKRLCNQLWYFNDQAERRHFWQMFTREAPVLFLLFSISAALLHFVLDSIDRLHTMSFWLLMLAACLPVVGAATRTLRTAHEFGRNTLRFQATSNELKQLATVFHRTANPQVKLDILQKVERVLEAERREWLRLMIDAEWFG